MTIIVLSRNFNSDYLSCDCGLRWVPGFFRSSSARLGDETLCAYPKSLKGKPLRGLRESQLNCGECLARMTHINEVVSPLWCRKSLACGGWQWQCTRDRVQNHPNISKNKQTKRVEWRSTPAAQQEHISKRISELFSELILWLAFTNSCSLHPICSGSAALQQPLETFCWGWVMRAAEIVENDVSCSHLQFFFPPPCCSDGPLELHTLSLLPSHRQVVFRGDRLPFHCTAALVDKKTTLHWRHNGQLVTSDPEMGVQLENSVLHDCTFITRYRCLRCSVFIEFSFSIKIWVKRILNFWTVHTYTAVWGGNAF